VQYLAYNRWIDADEVYGSGGHSLDKGRAGKAVPCLIDGQVLFVRAAAMGCHERVRFKHHTRGVMVCNLHQAAAEEIAHERRYDATLSKKSIHCVYNIRCWPQRHKHTTWCFAFRRIAQYIGIQSLVMNPSSTPKVRV
jgi:hypothetical protein